VIGQGWEQGDFWLDVNQFEPDSD